MEKQKAIIEVENKSLKNQIEELKRSLNINREISSDKVSSIKENYDT